MNYKYTIIDSQVSNCLTLKAQLNLFNDLELTAIVHNYQEAIASILKNLPDIVFIYLTDKEAVNYFNMLVELGQYIDKMPLLIGFSDTQKYAYSALKHGFFDYLLTPYSESEIRKTVFKLRKQRPKENNPSTICLKTYRDFHYLDTSEILYLQAKNNTTDFVLIDNDKVSVSKTLKSFENTLPENFIRIHQSFILNSIYVSRINYGKGLCYLRNNPQKIPFSKSYKTTIDQLQTLLSNNAIQHIN